MPKPSLDPNAKAARCVRNIRIGPVQIFTRSFTATGEIPANRPLSPSSAGGPFPRLRPSVDRWRRACRRDFSLSGSNNTCTTQKRNVNTTIRTTKRNDMCTDVCVRSAVRKSLSNLVPPSLTDAVVGVGAHPSVPMVRARTGQTRRPPGLLSGRVGGPDRRRSRSSHLWNPRGSRAATLRPVVCVNGEATNSRTHRHLAH